MTACTDDGLIHPTALGAIGGVAAASSPNLNPDSFTQAGYQYYGGQGTYLNPSLPSGVSQASEGCGELGGPVMRTRC